MQQRLFPLLVFSALVFFGFGALNGGLAWPYVWDISLESVPMGLEPKVA